MNIKNAIYIIEKHQKWRRGDKRIKQMVDVRLLCLAEDCLVVFAKNHTKLVECVAKNAAFKTKKATPLKDEKMDALKKFTKQLKENTKHKKCNPPPKSVYIYPKKVGE